MRRLTKRKYGGIIPAAQQDIFCSNFCDQCSQGTGDCKELKEMLERLTQIEEILGDEYDLDQLKELVQADREGRCTVLPCKVVSKSSALDPKHHSGLLEE